MLLYLIGTGWESCPRQERLYKKGRLRLDSCVSDSLFAGPGRECFLEEARLE